MAEKESIKAGVPKMAEENLNVIFESDEKIADNEICITINEDELDQPDDVSMDKNTNLHFHAAFGTTESLNEDLKCPKVDIDAENFMGWTPLMMACRNGRMDVVKILLEKGADVTRKNKLGVNIFGMSIATGKLDLVEMILRHMLRGGISRNRIQEELSPISLAILFKKNHLLTWLIQQGFDLNAATPKTYLTPLMFGAAVKNEKMINLLETKGANKQLKNYIGMDSKDISIWGKRGLQNLKIFSGSMRDQEVPPEVNTNQVFVPIDPQPKTPTDLKACLTPKPYKVPNNTPSAFVPSKASLPTYEYYMVNDTHSPNAGNENQTSSADYRKNNYRDNIFNFEPNNLYPNYMAPYNIHYPNCVPVINPTCGLPSPNPVTSVTPLMVTSPFQNFVATMKSVPQVQHLPMTILPSPQHPCKNPNVGMQVFLSPQVPMDHQANYLYGNNNPNYAEIGQNEVFYQMVSPSQNMFVEY